MPDIFDSFFADFDKKTNDYYDLIRIDPGYRVYFGQQDYFDLVENALFTSSDIVVEESSPNSRIIPRST